jgi:hypothetical protein
VEKRGAHLIIEGYPGVRLRQSRACTITLSYYTNMQQFQDSTRFPRFDASDDVKICHARAWTGLDSAVSRFVYVCGASRALSLPIHQAFLHGISASLRVSLVVEDHCTQRAHGEEGGQGGLLHWMMGLLHWLMGLLHWSRPDARWCDSATVSPHLRPPFHVVVWGPIRSHRLPHEQQAEHFHGVSEPRCARARPFTIGMVPDGS